jgi:diguanylate cyclase (GGDEF)-like protein
MGDAEAPVADTTDGVARDDGGLFDDVPPDVVRRVIRGINRSPSTVVTLIDADLKTRWSSRSTTWVTGTDPDSRVGRGSLERLHPDDVAPLLHALAQLRHANSSSAPAVPVIEPLRYRIRKADGSWFTMESLVLNLLDDEVVNGLVLIGRRVGGELDGVGYVLDLLVAEAPLPKVLAACAGLIPHYLGSAAVVGLVDGTPVIGAAPGSTVDRLAADDRWWRPTVGDGVARAPVDYAGFPEDAAEQARAAGFLSAWVLPVSDASTGEVIGCVVVWVKIAVELNVATDHSLRQTLRLASLVIGEQRRHHALRRDAVTDPLTGVGNRLALQQRLDDADGPVTVAIVDLDNFKPVNDSYGHDTGDAVLRVVAARILGAVRQDDLVTRLGGDEFAIVFSDGPSPDEVARSLRRVVDAVEAPIALDDELRLSVGASVGFATAPPDDAVRRADAALYEAKATKLSSRGRLGIA